MEAIVLAVIQKAHAINANKITLLLRQVMATFVKVVLKICAKHAMLREIVYPALIPTTLSMMKQRASLDVTLVVVPIV